jgi:hypothetical protein
MMLIGKGISAVMWKGEEVVSESQGLKEWWRDSSSEGAEVKEDLMFIRNVKE